MGSKNASTYSEGARHAYMHRTESLDYGIVLQGELTLILDESETVLKAGDVVIQRGTNHSWANRTDMPCRIAFFMMGAVIDANLKTALK